MRGFVLIPLLLAGVAEAQSPDIALGETVFQSFCAACHGPSAKGDGPTAKVLTVAPPDLTRLARDNGGVFPMFRVVRQIDGRDPTLQHGGQMPLFGALFDFPDGAIASETGQPIITAQPIADIAAWLATVQR